MMIITSSAGVFMNKYEIDVKTTLDHFEKTQWNYRPDPKQIETQKQKDKKWLPKFGQTVWRLEVSQKFQL